MKFITFWMVGTCDPMSTLHFLLHSKSRTRILTDSWNEWHNFCFVLPMNTLANLLMACVVWMEYLDIFFVLVLNFQRWSKYFEFFGWRQIDHSRKDNLKLITYQMSYGIIRKCFIIYMISFCLHYSHWCKFFWNFTFSFKVIDSRNTWFFLLEIYFPQNSYCQ